MSKSQKGDRKSYSELLKLCSKLAYKYINGRVNDKAIVDDVVQEILISIHKSRHTYDSDKPFTPWFYAISNFRLNDYLKKLYNNKELSNFDEMFENVLFEEKEFDKIEKSQLIEKSLSILNDKQKEIVRLMYIEGYSVKEASSSLSISESDAKVSAHRALKEIKEVFGK